MCQAVLTSTPYFTPEKQLYVVDAFIIMPIVQMRTPKQNNGKGCAANNEEAKQESAAVSTTPHVRWSRFLIAQLSSEFRHSI